jgi:D-3-phosphoglycerate dehydrogenase
VTATLKTGTGKTTVSGTLVGRSSPRIVRIDGYEFELLPAGRLLVFANEDTPGVIGRIGTLLGESRINIGGMQLGRTAGSKDALAVVAVDSAIPEDVMSAIRALPFIRHARQLEI